MSQTESGQLSEAEKETLIARWDKAAYRAQGSPFENVCISNLAKNTGTRAWSRPGGRVRSDTIARYIYLTFDELIEIEKLDMKSAVHLLEICEATFLFEEECNELGAFEEIDRQAYEQRMRFVEEFGLYQDFPVSLANLDYDLHELCVAEEIVTFIDLMEFLDRLSDKAWIGGTYRSLQNVFAHGDEKGLLKFFPYRMGHRGFHLPETLSFALNRISKAKLNSVLEYYERGRQRGRFGSRRMELPSCIEQNLLPEIYKSMHYFGKRQPRLLLRLHDAAYLSRELMFLNDPQSEAVLQWLVHLALGIFNPNQFSEISEELEMLSAPKDEELVKDLRRMLTEDA